MEWVESLHYSLSRNEQSYEFFGTEIQELANQAVLDLNLARRWLGSGAIWWQKVVTPPLRASMSLMPQVLGVPWSGVFDSVCVKLMFG